MRRIAVGVGVLAMVSGCLSRSHVIPQRELAQLAQTDPHQRGERVRVVQGFQSEDDPPEAPRVRTSTTVVVVAPVRVGPARRGPARRGPRVPDSAKSKADEAWVWVVLAAAVGIGLAVSEGARYDGWVQLHPMHPVHLYGPHGEYTWLPLAQVDPQTAAWARKAIVRPGEGPWRPLGRAPLDRQGWSYSITMGSAQLPSIYGPDELGFMSHIQIGYFPEHALGILFDIGLGWTENEIGGTIFDSRYALELDYMALDAGKLHAGLFGQFGIGGRIEDGPKEAERTGTLYGGGAILQLELTTRLAITARAGMTRMFDSTVSDIGLGISVY